MHAVARTRQQLPSECSKAGSTAVAVTPVTLPVQFHDWKDVARFIAHHGQYPVVNKTDEGAELIEVFDSLGDALEFVQSNRETLVRAGNTNHYVWYVPSAFQAQHDDRRST